MQRPKATDIRPSVIEVPAPVLRLYPGSRVRLDPSIIRDLSAFLLAGGAIWEKQSRMTLRGLKGKARDLRKGQIRWARAMVRALEHVVNGLTDSVDLREVDRIRDEWDAALAVGGSR